LVLFDSHQLGTAMPRGGHPPHQIQALDRTQPGLPMKKGRAGTMTHDYKRHGITTLFAALNVRVRARFDHADLVLPQRIEPHRVLGVELAPAVIVEVSERLQRVIVSLRKPALDQAL
jgi:hypothetical protein